MQLLRLSTSRDLRVDFFRGLALWWIYTDHIPGDVLAHYSLRNFAMSDAAEVFVLLAGYGAGLAYGTRLPRNGYVSTAADVMKRAWVLYVTHIFLFMLFSAQVAYSATALNRLNYLEELRLDVLGDDPYRSIFQALLLRFQPSLLNILPLYVVLLVFLAATIWLLRWPRVLFGLSLAIYLVVRFTGLNLDAWDGGGWFFDPFAWQFLFIIGVLLACAPMAPPRNAWVLDIGAAVVAVVGIAITLVVERYPGTRDILAQSVIRPLVIEDKTGLYPSRLISVLALTWLTVRLIRFDSTWLRSRWAAPLVLIGQNSLPVFCAGIVFGFAARLGLEYDDRTWMQIVINLLGAIGMFGIGALAAWYRIKDRPPPASRALPGHLAAKLMPVDVRADAG